MVDGEVTECSYVVHMPDEGIQLEGEGPADPKGWEEELCEKIEWHTAPEIEVCSVDLEPFVKGELESYGQVSVIGTETQIEDHWDLVLIRY